MVRKSFFSKISDMLRDKDDDEESVEDIDRRVEAEIAAIKSQKVETLEGSKILLDDWKCEGDLVYLMDLAPLYALIGGRNGMLGRRLPDACGNIFGRLVPAGEGHGRMKGDFFIMSFADPSRQAGFRKAAEIINIIGSQMIGDRFETIEIPNLMVAADPADLSGDNGGFDPAKAKAQVESGGVGCRLGAGPDEPVWFKLSVKKAAHAADLVRMASGAKGADDEPRGRHRNDPDWVDKRSDRREKISYDPMRMERRRGGDRRGGR